MTVIHATLRDIGDIFGRRERMRIVAVRAAVVEAATAGAEVIAAAVPVDQGQLKQSIRAGAWPGGAGITIDAPHASSVEFGSRPHTPPLAPLVEWVLRHAPQFGLASRAFRALAIGPVRTRGGQLARDRAVARRQAATVGATAIARKIQRKIAKYGTKPTHFVRNSLPRLQAIANRLVARAVRRRR